MNNLTFLIKVRIEKYEHTSKNCVLYIILWFSITFYINVGWSVKWCYCGDKLHSLLLFQLSLVQCSKHYCQAQLSWAEIALLLLLRGTSIHPTPTIHQTPKQNSSFSPSNNYLVGSQYFTTCSRLVCYLFKTFWQFCYNLSMTC